MPSSERVKVLFAASELYPLVKTGGLADFAYGLPRALNRAGADTVIVLPAYRAVMQQLNRPKLLTTCSADQTAGPEARVLRSTVPGTRQKLWLVDTPALYDRAGGPYLDADGADWPDNAERFAHFSRVVTALAAGDNDLDWQPDVVHCNDWQTALVPALLAERAKRPATVFTVHNLGYQGNFPADTLSRLQLPAQWWSFDKLEFHQQLSFIKGGLVFADRITTVSPRYAEEIQAGERGYGLDGVLRHRREALCGILNGVDYRVWNPATDTLIDKPYRRHELFKKAANKIAYLKRHRLTEQERLPLLGFIGRLAYQKGIDLLLAGMEHTLARGANWAVLGSGDKRYEAALQALRSRYPRQLALTIGYDEATAHQIEASCDIFVMPSIYEPCGLNQLYSLKYGTIPVVSDTGGLADTVVDTDEASLANRSATGFRFPAGDEEALRAALDRALALYTDVRSWQQLQKTAMRADFSWQRSASEYLALYQALEPT